MNTVLDALLESLEGLRVTFGDTPESFKGDRAQTGDVREWSVTGLLTAYFPRTWFVGKGPIYDSRGNSSQSIDNVLCSPIHPPINTGKRSVLLAEGVHAATETKPDLHVHTPKSEFHRGLQQIVSVKRLQREVPMLGKKDDPERHRVPCALFTAKIGDADSAIQYMDVFKNSDGVKTSGGVFLWLPGSDHHVLAWYIYLLYSFAPPEPYMSEPILWKYLRTLTFPPDVQLYRSQ
jgi:hypothetical protein